MYKRVDSTGGEIVGEYDNGVSWIAHPDEAGKRASHALRTEQGVWLIDPIYAPAAEERIASLGSVTGVLILSSYHARDAGAFARRHDVSVHIPEWIGRVEDRVDAPVRRYTDTPDAEFRMLPCRPFPGWEEVFCYHEPTKALVVADSLGTIDTFLLDGERLGVGVFRRLQPPDQLAGLEPDRVLVGHGEPVTENATQALQSALDGTRGTFPTALLDNGAKFTYGMVRAMID